MTMSRNRALLCNRIVLAVVYILLLNSTRASAALPYPTYVGWGAVLPSPADATEVKYMSLYEDPQGSLIVQYAYRSPGGKFEVNYIDLNTQKIVLSSAANPEIAQQTGMQPYIEQYGWVRLLPSPLSQRLADGTVVSQVWFPACAWLINGMLSVVRPDGTATTIAPVEFLPRPMRYELKDTRGCRAPYPSDGISTTLRSVWGDLQRLSDDSFLLMDTGGPFVVRFDKSLRTEFVSPRNNFLVLDGAAILHEDAKLAGDTTHYEKLYDFVWGLAKGRMP